MKRATPSGDSSSSSSITKSPAVDVHATSLRKNCCLGDVIRTRYSVGGVASDYVGPFPFCSRVGASSHAHALPAPLDNDASGPRPVHFALQHQFLIQFLWADPVLAQTEIEGRCGIFQVKRFLGYG